MMLMAQDFGAGAGTGAVALLIDGDNLSPAFAGRLIVAAGALGRLTLKRVYGRAEALSAWDTTTGLRLIRSDGKKNGADMMLCIDAVDLSCRGGAQAFAIASSDRDFTALALYLVEKGHHVLGLGEAKAPAGFRHACSRFVELAEAAPVPPAGTAPDPAQVDEFIRSQVCPTPLSVAVLGQHVRRHLERPFPQSLGHATLKGYLKSRPGLYAIDPSPDGELARWIGPKP